MPPRTKVTDALLPALGTVIQRTRALLRFARPWWLDSGARNEQGTEWLGIRAQLRESRVATCNGGCNLVRLRRIEMCQWSLLLQL